MGDVPFGLDVDSTGHGTTPIGVQTINRFQYSSLGILSGLLPTQSSSGMQVTYSPGAVVIPTSSTGAVIAPYSTSTALSIPTNTSGSVKTLTVFAYCPLVSGGSAVIDSSYNTPAPTYLSASVPYITIDKFSVPNGASAMTQATNLNTRDYALPVSVSQSRIVDINPRPAFNSFVPWAKTLFGSASFYLATDRLLRVYITQAIASKAGGQVGSYQWTITDSVNGGLDAGTPVLDYPATRSDGTFSGGLNQYTIEQSFTAGSHTLSVYTTQITGDAGQAVWTGGLGTDGTGGMTITRPYPRVELFDEGIHI